MTSKLPNVGTTIFSVMSALANECGAINLSQGFPDFPVDGELTELVGSAMKEGHNQYAAMPGTVELRRAISEITNAAYGRRADHENEITVTSGATEALFAAVSVVVSPGDEVIMFDPSYDSYEPAVILNQGVPVRIPLTFPEYKIDWQRVSDALSEKTRLIILNSPNNPAGSVIDEDDFLMLKNIALENNIYILSDEVYEHIIFDGRKHFSVLRDEELFERSFAVSSFGKTFHVTGWKVGYCTAPQHLTKEFRKVHQFLTFSTSTPFQYALAEYARNTDRILQLKEFYQLKRDKFTEAFKDTGFKPLNCSGTYFQLMDYSGISGESDVKFAEWLTREKKVASIPVSVFYKEGTDNKVLRFCFAKQDETILRAAEMLRGL